MKRIIMILFALCMMMSVVACNDGGEVNTERMARVLLDEYRSCKLGCFTLETPEMMEGGGL